MSDDGSNAEQQGNESNTQAENSGYTPPASQDDLNRIIAERVERERRKFADYDDVKAKAAKFEEIEQANKSELEKLTEERETIARERDAARAEVLRYRVAAKHGITDEDAELFLTGSDEETLTKQAQRLSERVEDAGRPRSPRPDPNQGRANNGSASTADQFAAAIGGQFTT